MTVMDLREHPDIWHHPEVQAALDRGIAQIANGDTVSMRDIRAARECERCNGTGDWSGPCGVEPCAFCNGTGST